MIGMIQHSNYQDKENRRLMTYWLVVLTNGAIKNGCQREIPPLPDRGRRKRLWKEGNHEGHEEHEEELFFSFVALVFFVVQGFYAFCDTLW